MECKNVVKKVLVGVVLKKYVDEQYIRDRDSVVPLYEGETDADAINVWCEEHKNWIREDEKKFVKVIREVGADEYAGPEVWRKWWK